MAKLTNQAPCEYSCQAGYQRYQNSAYCHPKPCPITPLAPPTDDEVKPFLDGTAAVREDKLSPAMNKALNDLRRAVQSEGGTLTVNSAWRPPSYQTYFFDIVSRNNDFIKNPTLTTAIPACAAIKDAVTAAHKKHQLKTKAGETSPHSSGIAFDANWSGVSNERIDTLAKQFNLHRPFVIDDPIHFQFIK